MKHAILILSCLTLSAVALADESNGGNTDATTRFDFHAVRGREPVLSLRDRFEGELHFEMIGKARAQGMADYGDQWSGNAHLLWDGVVGESFKTSFEVQSDGRYDISVQLTVAPDYGRFEMWLNEQRLVEAIDLYGAKVELAKPVAVNDVVLKAGRQSLVFKLIGANPAAHKFNDVRYLLGLDYVQLVRKHDPLRDQPREASGSPRHSQPKELAATTTRFDASHAMSFSEVQATLRQFCYGCHSDDMIEGEVNLGQFSQPEALLADIKTTRRIQAAVARHEMPPREEQQPSDQQRSRLAAALGALIEEYLKDHRSATPIVMRRLNRFEYNNAVRDLLKLKGDIYPLPEKTIRADQPYFDPATGRFPDVVLVGNRTLGKNQVEKQIFTGVSPFAIDLQAEGGFNNRGRQLSVSPILVESFLKLGRSILNSPEFDEYSDLTSSFFTAPADLTLEQQQRLARERLAPFLERAFRGRVEQQVLARYHRFFVRQLQATGSFQQSLKDVVAAVLASPRFVYISESETTSDANASLSGYELATRLSFFLWSTIPDEELLAKARDGSLTRRDELDGQLKRMLESPRSQALSQNFARQWLRLDQLVTAVPDFERFPRYYSRIGCEQWKFGLQTMIEPLLLFESIMVEDRSIMLLIDSNYSYRSDELQSWYDDKLPFDNRENRDRFNTFQQSYRKRKLENRREGGVITSAATLTMTSAPLRTSPIVRGTWVATAIFNQPPPPPPDVVPPIEDDDREIESKGLTLRQRLKQHQVNQSCKTCHSKIDPLGFALENFDAVGRWRNHYNSGLEIDASGALFGQVSFNDVEGLKDAILDHPQWFMRAFCEHLLSYALARELEISDTPAVDHILARVQADHGQFTTVVREIVLSHPFRYRAQQERATN